MKNRSRIFAIFSFVFLLAALSLPLQPIVALDLDYSDLPWILQSLSPFHVITLGLCLLSAYLAWNASGLFIYLGPFTILAVVFINLVTLVDIREVPREIWVSNAGLASVFLLCFKRDVREVLLDSRKRWWLTDPRKELHMRAALKTWANENIFGHSENLSQNGVLLEINSRHSADLNALKKLEVGKMIHLKLDVGPLHTLQIQAQVARKIIDPLLPAQGVALRFVNLTPFERRQIRELLRDA